MTQSEKAKDGSQASSTLKAPTAKAHTPASMEGFIIAFEFGELYHCHRKGNFK